MNPLVGMALAEGMNMGSRMLHRRDMMNQVPDRNNVRNYYDKLTDKFEDYVNDKKLDVIPKVAVQYNSPELAEILENKDKFLQVERSTHEPHGVQVNEYAPKELLAEGLGQLASSGTGYGKALQDFNNNDKYKQAMKVAQYLAPAAYSMGMAGDDDYEGALGLAVAANAPSLLQSIDSKRHGLGILHQAGLPTGGSKARMAGELLLELGVPFFQASAGNAVGNMLDAAPNPYIPQVSL